MIGSLTGNKNDLLPGRLKQGGAGGEGGEWGGGGEGGTECQQQPAKKKVSISLLNAEERLFFEPPPGGLSLPFGFGCYSKSSLSCFTLTHIPAV